MQAIKKEILGEDDQDEDDDDEEDDGDDGDEEEESDEEGASQAPGAAPTQRIQVRFWVMWPALASFTANVSCASQLFLPIYPKACRDVFPADERPACARTTPRLTLSI